MAHYEALLLAGLIEQIEPWREQRTATAATGTNNLDTKRVDPGWVYFVERAAVLDATNNATSWRLGTWDGTVLYLAEEQRSPVANTLYWFDAPLTVHEGLALRAEIQGATAGDALTLNVWGTKVKRRDGPPRWGKA